MEGKPCSASLLLINNLLPYICAKSFRSPKGTLCEPPLLVFLGTARSCHLEEKKRMCRPPEALSFGSMTQPE
jgi:hypothetical protein